MTNQIALTKMVAKLLEHWDLQPGDQAALLSISEKSECAAHLLSIHKNLRMLFPKNPELAYSWMSTRNKAFDDLPPVEVIKKSGASGMMLVREYLDRALQSEV